MVRLIISVVLVVFTGWTSSATERQFTIPNPREGNIGGKEGTLMWPTHSNEEAGLMDPQGCLVQLYSAHAGLLTYPCASWFAAPPGGYTAWLEMHDRLSRQFRIRVSGREFTGRGSMAKVAMYPAGRIRLGEGVDVPPDHTFRLLHVGAPEFDRRLLRTNAGTEVPFPEGTAVGGIFSPDGSAALLSKPVSVLAGRRVDIIPREPRDADLMLIISKLPLPTEERRKRQDEAILEIGDQTRRSDVVFESDGRIVAIWYDVPAGGARVTLIPSGWSARVTLRQHEVTTIREIMTQVGI